MRCTHINIDTQTHTHGLFMLDGVVDIISAVGVEGKGVR